MPLGFPKHDRQRHHVRQRRDHCSLFAAANALVPVSNRSRRNNNLASTDFVTSITTPSIDRQLQRYQMEIDLVHACELNAKDTCI